MRCIRLSADLSPDQGRVANGLMIQQTAVILLSGLRQVYVLTVIGPTGNGGLALRGLFIGDDEECFKAASKLSLEVNFTLVPRPIQKVRYAAINACLKTLLPM